MATSRLSLMKRSIIGGVFGNQDGVYFWWQRFLPRWFPLFLGLSLGFVLAFLTVDQKWQFAVPIAVLIPVAILFIRYPFVAAVIWLLVAPYFVDTSGSAGRFIFWVAHRALVPGVLLMTIIFSAVPALKKEPARFNRAELVMFLCLLFGFANVIYFFDSRQEWAFDQLIYRIYDRLLVPFCLYWLIRLSSPGQKQIKASLVVAFITIIAQGGIGITSWFAPDVLPIEWRDLEGTRTVGSLSNVAVYTSTLMLCALLVFQYAVNSRSIAKIWRWVLLSVFGLALYSIFMSFSRGSWLGEIIVLITLIFLYPKLMLRFTFILGIIIYMLSGTVLAGQVAWGYERLTGEQAQRSATSRVTANAASLQMIQAKPLFGWGFGNYDLNKRPYMKRVGNFAVHNETSHHTFLTMLVEFGLIFFVLYMFPVIWWLIGSIKVRKNLPKEGFWSWRLVVLLWLVIIHMIIVSSFMDMFRFYPFGTTIWWMTLALIGNIVQRYSEPPDTDSQTSLISNNTGNAASLALA